MGDHHLVAALTKEPKLQNFISFGKSEDFTKVGKLHHLHKQLTHGSNNTEYQVDVQPKTSLCTTLNGYMDFDVPRSIDTMEEMSLRLTFANATGNDLVMGNSYFIPEWVEIYSGSKSICKLTDTELFYWWALDRTSDEFADDAALFNVGTSWGAGQTVATTQSQTLYVDIGGCMKQIELHPVLLRDPLWVRVQFKTLAKSVDSCTTTSGLTLTAASLRIKDRRLTPDEFHKAEQVYHEGVGLKYIYTKWIAWDQTITTTAPLSKILDSMQGACLGLFTFIRATSVTSAQVSRTFTNPAFPYSETLEIKDELGSNIFNGIVFTNRELKALHGGKIGSTLFANLNIIPIVWSKDMRKSIDVGVHDGFHYLSGKETFTLKTEVDTGHSSVTTTMVGFYQGIMKIQNGELYPMLS